MKEINYDDFIERYIVTGLIISDSYIETVRRLIDVSLFESNSARLISLWCIEYFDQYGKAPGKDIELIFLDKSKKLDSETTEDIREILAALSDEFSREKLNIEYLIEKSIRYFKKRKIESTIENVQTALKKGKVETAESEILSFTPEKSQVSESIEPFQDLSWIRKALNIKKEELIKFPKALGKFWSGQFVRDAFVAFVAPEKRGKSFMLLEVAVKAVESNCNVAFFQAGDMSELQQLRRLAIYLSKKSDDPKYCGELWIPVLDCEYNQRDTCDREERESDQGIFYANEEITFENLVEAIKDNPEYRPCTNCQNIKPVPYLKLRKAIHPLSVSEVKKRITRWKKHYKGRLKIATYPNETLTISEIKRVLSEWERFDNFVVDVIVIDYADILAPDPDITKFDFRNQINKIWQRLRSLSTEKHCLIVTATQAAASSYDKDLIKLSDFSEDKRKYAHVTAMYGLNQTPEEKKIGVLRINELVVRDGGLQTVNQVKILQRLEIGRPVLTSYF